MCERARAHFYMCVNGFSNNRCVCAHACVRVCVCLCVYEDINLYNDTGMTGITSRR